MMFPIQNVHKAIIKTMPARTWDRRKAVMSAANAPEKITGTIWAVALRGESPRMICQNCQT